MYAGFNCIKLDAENHIWAGNLPPKLLLAPQELEVLWNLHPAEYHTIQILGKKVKTPRWQQAYNKTYQYSGEQNDALAVPEELYPFWNWSREVVDRRLNGLLLNWYDGQLGHYIGKHRDSIANLIIGAPIVTISLGQERVFRLRPYRGKGYFDFPIPHGTVLIMPYATNQTWTHEVPATKKLAGKRISVTLRAFKT